MQGVGGKRLATPVNDLAGMRVQSIANHAWIICELILTSYSYTVEPLNKGHTGDNNIIIAKFTCKFCPS